MTIAMSGMMRLGGTIFNLDKAFEGVGGCNSFVAARGKGQELSKGNNCGNAVLFEIKKFLEEMRATPVNKIEKTNSETVIEKDLIKCPECGEPLGAGAHEGGCISCKNCGYSKC